MFYNYFRTTQKPILAVILGGESAANIEPSPNSKIVNRILGVLKRIFGENQVGKLLFSDVTRWQTDEYSRGSYSFIPVGASKNDYDFLAKPIGNLHFAGEATNRHHPSTVSGAILSGIREAGKIIQSFSTQNTALQIQQECELAENFVLFLNHSSLQASYLIHPYMEYPYIRKDKVFFDSDPLPSPVDDTSKLFQLANCATTFPGRPPTSVAPSKKYPGKRYTLFNIENWVDDIPIFKEVIGTKFSLSNFHNNRLLIF